MAADRGTPQRMVGTATVSHHVAIVRSIRLFLLCSGFVLFKITLHVHNLKKAMQYIDEHFFMTC